MGVDGTGLARLVHRHTTGLRRSGPYLPPSDVEVGRIAALADAVTDGADPVAVAVALGLEVVELDGRLVLAPPQPGSAPWLVLAVAPGVVPRVLVEVPHPWADLHTESAALAVVARHPDAVLLQAGAHRVAGAAADARTREDCPADVAARPDAAFSRLADRLVERLGVAQVQWHGFADRGDVDVVCSPGSAAPGRLLARVESALAACGLRVLGPDDPRVTDLAGRRNVQGLAAARYGAQFVHLEVSRTVRDDRDRLLMVADAVADAIDAPGSGH